jgi:hypothetical protein
MTVTHRLWSTLLDQAGLGLIAKQSIVGQKRDDDTRMLSQRTKREQCILYCPLDLTFDDKKTDVKTLPELLERYCSKQPYSTVKQTTSTNRQSKSKKKNEKNYYDFDRLPYDFEVKIPSFGASPPSSSGGESTTTTTWTTTRSLQLTSLTTYLFLGIQRRQQKQQQPPMDGEDENETTAAAAAINFNHNELEVPPILNVSKICDNNAIRKTEIKEYELVGGMLFDEGDYVPVLRDEGRRLQRLQRQKNAKETNEQDNDDDNDDDDDDDDEAWKLLETEEVIPMSEADVLEFLKGDADADGDAPCGTLAIYRRKDPAALEEMNNLLSDIIFSQVSGTLNSNADYYIEEEIIEDEEECDDDDDEEDDDDDDNEEDKVTVPTMAAIQE